MAGSRRLWWRRGWEAERGGRRLRGALLRLCTSPVTMQRQFPAVLCLEGAPDSVHRQRLDFPIMRAETGTHSANRADDLRYSSGAALGLVLDMPVVVQRQVRSPRLSRSSTSLSWRRGSFPWS